MSRISKNEVLELMAFIEQSVHQIPISEEIATEAGLLRIRYGKSHGLRLQDAFITTTAIANNIPVVCLDNKHFSVLTDDLVVPYLSHTNIRSAVITKS